MRVPIPATAETVAITVTVTGSSGPGWVQAYPCDGSVPDASVLNHGAGQTVANTVFVGTGPRGDVCLRPSTGTQLIVDYAGHFPVGSDMVAQGASRVFDSRAGGGPVQAGTVKRIKAPDGAVAVAAVLTVTQPASDGWVIAHPCGTSVPNVSQVNFRAGQSIANTTIVDVGDNGLICVWSSATTHLILDSFGEVDTAPDLRLSAGTRLLDTRSRGRVPAGGVVKARVPERSAAAAVTVTIVEPDYAGWATAYACDSPRPGTSTLNFATGQTVANSAVIPVGPSGEICVHTTAGAHLIIDYAGHVPPGSDFTPGGPSRVFDSRASGLVPQDGLAC